MFSWLRLWNGSPLGTLINIPAENDLGLAYLGSSPFLTLEDWVEDCLGFPPWGSSLCQILLLTVPSVYVIEIKQK